MYKKERIFKALTDSVPLFFFQVSRFKDFKGLEDQLYMYDYGHFPASQNLLGTLHWVAKEWDKPLFCFVLILSNVTFFFFFYNICLSGYLLLI